MATAEVASTTQGEPITYTAPPSPPSAHAYNVPMPKPSFHFESAATTNTVNVDRPRRKPFAAFVKRLTNFNKSSSNDKDKSNEGKKSNGARVLKHKKNNTFSGRNNNPYPQSGHLHEQPQNSQPSVGTSAREQDGDRSYAPSTASAEQDDHHVREKHNSHSNKSGAPTLSTNAETVHSDAGHSRAATTTTGAGALSSMDGRGGNSTFSSPNQSEHSLATTLTTIQSSNAPNVANAVSGQHTPHNGQSQPNGTQFSHQYPVSPAPSSMTASAIPRHLHTDSNAPTTYSSATANNMLSDNASILTLASSSKRRRRSMDTDASVRALAPSSVFGGSRESLPMSVLSGGQDPSRQSIGGIPGSASAERASVYSSSGLAREIPPTHQSALASERGSYYARPGDTKSLRSVTNIKDDARSISNIDARSQYDGKSLHDVASLRSLDARSERDGQHGRNGSIPGIGGAVYTPSLLRQASGAGTLSLSRRSSNWGEDEKENNELEGKKHE